MFSTLRVSAHFPRLTAALRWPRLAAATPRPLISSIHTRSRSQYWRHRRLVERSKAIRENAESSIRLDEENLLVEGQPFSPLEGLEERERKAIELVKQFQEEDKQITEAAQPPKLNRLITQADLIPLVGDSLAERLSRSVSSILALPINEVERKFTVAKNALAEHSPELSINDLLAIDPQVFLHIDRISQTAETLKKAFPDYSGESLKRIFTAAPRIFHIKPDIIKKRLDMIKTLFHSQDYLFPTGGFLLSQPDYLLKDPFIHLASRLDSLAKETEWSEKDILQLIDYCPSVLESPLRIPRLRIMKESSFPTIVQENSSTFQGEILSSHLPWNIFIARIHRYRAEKDGNPSIFTEKDSDLLENRSQFEEKFPMISMIPTKILLMPQKTFQSIFPAFSPSIQDLSIVQARSLEEIQKEKLSAMRKQEKQEKYGKFRREKQLAELNSPLEERKQEEFIGKQRKKQERKAAAAAAGETTEKVEGKDEKIRESRDSVVSSEAPRPPRRNAQEQFKNARPNKAVKHNARAGGFRGEENIESIIQDRDQREEKSSKPTGRQESGESPARIARVPWQARNANKIPSKPKSPPNPSLDAELEPTRLTSGSKKTFRSGDLFVKKYKPIREKKKKFFKPL